MDYSYLDLLCYLFIYSFIGWVTEVTVISIKTHALRNRGFFNLPFCLSYGVVMDILIVLFPTMEQNFVMQYLAALAVSAVITFLSGSLSKRSSRILLWDYQENNLFAGNKKSFAFGLLQGLLFFLAVLLIHPLFFLIVTLLPNLVKIIACCVIALMLLYDLIVILVALRRKRSPEEIQEIISRQQEGKTRLGNRITDHTWRRICKAYPNVTPAEMPEKSTFAKGICFEKLVWVFLIMSVAGCLFEMVFVWATTGNLMSRSSLIYGPFSIIWGFAAVILTIVLQRLTGKEDRWVFLAGCFVGGIYEYLCSVISEVVFETTFWDYSDMPFNFGGRTNLLFCLFWGLLSVWWVKWMFPKLSRWIEKIPPIIGEVITWVIVALLSLDCILSGVVLLRYVDRIDNPVPDNVIEEFLDAAYPDSMLEVIWESMRLTE